MDDDDFDMEFPELDEETVRALDQREMEYMSQVVYEGDNKTPPNQYDSYNPNALSQAGELSTLKRKLAQLESEAIKMKESQSHLSLQHQKEMESLQLEFENRLNRLETAMKFKDQEIYELSQSRMKSIKESKVRKGLKDVSIMTDSDTKPEKIFVSEHKIQGETAFESHFRDLILQAYSELRLSGASGAISFWK
ncbi:hypothetical protein HDU67_009315 [Dinochytrium kinnereticum]|nr:hypothetical protein HDU67_009315 [Dinochytrium kinnereticum]